ncbi:DoxX family protein [Pseudomonas sp. EL_65y_Pfl2_R95]|uniref:DoxX family protein n=1 Tax=Pseudomonas sp. EL_65y_Pfl2_R95 TaxID=3088698 RepID=UPI0030DC09B0
MIDPANLNVSAPVRIITKAIDVLKAIPYSLIAFIGRFAIAAIFWKSGQTKVSGFEVDIVSGTFNLGFPSLSPSAIPLFAEEYKLPFLSPEFAATLSACAEHFLPILILFGFATRFSAMGLLGMTLVIQLLVYPGAYPTHGVWAAVLLMLMSKGPGMLSLDHLIARRYGYKP